MKGLRVAIHLFAYPDPPFSFSAFSGLQETDLHGFPLGLEKPLTGGPGEWEEK